MDDLIPATVEATAASKSIPLELAPLLAPYRKHQHLSLRVERLPIQARLTKGNNNGDRTWSLTPDDLDGLAYLPPEGMDQAHTLAIRIISLDDDYGATLAVLDLPVSPGDARPGTAPAAISVPDAAAADNAGELPRLRDELAAVKAFLLAREAELAEARRKVAQAQAEGASAAESRQTIAAELAEARAAWEAELQQRLANAAADTAVEFEKSRAAWEAELQKRLAEAAAEAAAELERSRAAWEAELQQRLAEAAAEAAATLERSRIAWQEEQRNLSARSEARAREESEQARERWRQEADAALAQAAAAWRAAEADRLASAAAQWQAQSAQTLAQATTRLEAAEAALAEARARAEGDQAELRRLRSELATAKASLVAHEAELAEVRQKAEQARTEGSRRAIEAELAKARAAWEAELQQRLANAAADAAVEFEKSRAAWEAELQKRLAEAAAEAAAELERSRAAWQAEQEERLARSEEQASERWLQRAEAALSKAEAAWKAEEAARLAEAEAEWRSQSAQALAEAEARAEQAEAALAEARAQAENDQLELSRLRDQRAAARAVPEVRDREPAEERSAMAEPLQDWRQDPVIARADPVIAPRRAVNIGRLPQVQQLLAARVELRTDERAPHREALALVSRRPRQWRIGRGLIGGGATLAVLAMAVIFYPRLEPMVLERWWPKLVAVTIGGEPLLRTTASQSQPADAAQPAARRIVIGDAFAHVRERPSASAPLVTILPRDTEVTPLERRGTWVLIRIGGGTGSFKQEGWVYASSLKEAAGS